jgi:DNA-binding NarL/FixJ family response regulator
LLKTKPITVVLGRFDDLFAGGLRGLIERDLHLQLVACDVQPSRIGVVLRGHRPAVAVLDARGLDGLLEVRDLTREHPETRLVLLAKELSAADCAEALGLGASAYLGRETQSRDLLSAIHLAARGLKLMPRTMSSLADGPFAGAELLTRRELDVLPLLSRAHSNAEIALELHVGIETVRTHTRSIYRKLGVSSRRGLARMSAADLLRVDG